MKIGSRNYVLESKDGLNVANKSGEWADFNYTKQISSALDFRNKEITLSLKFTGNIIALNSNSWLEQRYTSPMRMVQASGWLYV